MIGDKLFVPVEGGPADNVFGTIVAKVGCGYKVDFTYFTRVISSELVVAAWKRQIGEKGSRSTGRGYWRCEDSGYRYVKVEE